MEGATPFLVMSESAFRSLGKDQEKRLNRHAELLFSPLNTIEKYGGGSARCMIAGIFLPKMNLQRLIIAVSSARGLTRWRGLTTVGGQTRQWS
jgi:hypothetical protein